jgi:uncharacterized protein YijF (DUF1287 family)
MLLLALLSCPNFGVGHAAMDNFASASLKSIVGGIGFALAALAPMEAAGEQPSVPLSAPASQLVAAARAQVGITTIYDPAFVKLAYPGGDLPRERGVCTDVIVRAYRDAFGIDLQQLVHADMLASFANYPPMWGLRAPDTSIDHRRVPNLKVFFRRKGRELPVTRSPADYAPGDLVTQELPGGLLHIAIVSDTRSQDRTRPLVIHNIGRGTMVEDTLFAYRITGHFRFGPLANERGN